MKLSLTLPTLFPEPAMRAIEKVRATLHDMDYEIVVVSPFEISGPNIVWVKEETPRGSGAAQAIAAEHATGDVIGPMVDDMEFLPGWAKEGIETLLRCERGRPYAVGIGQTNLIVGTAFGIYYPFFPLVRRSTLDRVGGYFRPEFRHHFIDSDLALRIWSAGGACGFTENNYVVRKLRGGGDATMAERLAGSRSASVRSDMDIFVQRWGARYGQGWPMQDVYDIIIDVDPIFRHFVATENTIYLNTPLFKQAHEHYVQMMAALHNGRTSAPFAAG
jgi:hypothetical protein